MALYICQVLHIVDFWGLAGWELRLRPLRFFYVQLKGSQEPSDLRGSLSPTSVYSTWQSQAVTHPIMNRARRCLTSVIEQTPMSERRIPYGNCLVSHYVAPVIFCLRGKLIQVKMVLFKPIDLDHFTIETKYTF